MPPDRSFGEEGARLSCGGCLRPSVLLDHPRRLQRTRDAGESELARPRSRLDEPTLWDAYLTALSQRGRAVSDEETMASLPVVARDRTSHDDLWQLAEDLPTHDETCALWRMRHVQMAERQIGTKSGTGGSTGAPYLRERTRLYYFPLLWELRGWL
ncbi:tryptophan 2,3-dioxygenase family protein [Nonomuraea sp. NPDC049152]|uniref:tryptophan 2,3-dioxygenase family protein n=1 Tax=Nonomuraea sp. NPDC049152 TaxID=3154350 RepID=UPI0033E6F68F